MPTFPAPHNSLRFTIEWLAASLLGLVIGYFFVGYVVSIGVLYVTLMLNPELGMDFFYSVSNVGVWLKQLVLGFSLLVGLSFFQMIKLPGQGITWLRDTMVGGLLGGLLVFPLSLFPPHAFLLTSGTLLAMAGIGLMHGRTHRWLTLRNIAWLQGAGIAASVVATLNLTFGGVAYIEGGVGQLMIWGLFYLALGGWVVSQWVAQQRPSAPTPAPVVLTEPQAI